MTDPEKIKKYFWISLTLVAGIFSVSVIVQNLWHARTISRQINQMEVEQAMYRHSIAEDSTLLERLKYDEYLEQYAREQYRMHRTNEKVFIIKK